MKNITFIVLVIVAACMLVAGAEAHGRVFVGGGVVVGQPYYPYPPYYGYPYYAYSPYAYPYGTAPYPVPYGYAPAAGQVPPPDADAYAPPPPADSDRYYHDDNGDYCREYTRTITIDGHHEKSYGNACREPDGKWKIVD